MAKVLALGPVKGHPGITRIQLKSGQYKYRVRFNNFTRTADTLEEAEAKLAKLKLGTTVAAKPDMTLDEYATKFWLNDQEKSVRRTTYNGRFGVYTNHIKGPAPKLGQRRLRSLEKRHIQDWVNGLADAGYKSSTITTYLETLNVLLNDAKDAKLIDENAANRVYAPKSDRPPRIVLTDDEVKALVDVTEDQYQAAVLIAAYCGLRVGEVFGLTKGNLDNFLEKIPRLHVEQQIVSIPGQPTCFGPLKTKRSRRAVPMPAPVLDALRWHMEHVPLGVYDTLFHHGGEMVREWKQTDIMTAARKAAGLTVRGESWHALRHYCGTSMAQDAVNLKVIAVRLGETEKSVIEHYLHASPDDDRRIVDGFDLRWFRARSREIREDPTGTTSDLR